MSSHALLVALVGGSLVIVDQTLELSILLEVLLVTLVTKGDHALLFSVEIGINLGLGNLVGIHSGGQLVDTSIGLLTCSATVACRAYRPVLKVDSAALTPAWAGQVALSTSSQKWGCLCSRL